VEEWGEGGEGEMEEAKGGCLDRFLTALILSDSRTLITVSFF
jgi:hypothetical protein